VVGAWIRPGMVTDDANIFSSWRARRRAVSSSATFWKTRRPSASVVTMR